MEKIYKCFISSTFEDLQEERKTVLEAVLDHRNMPVGMEHFSASDESQWKYITKMLAGCDYFIVIVAHRYGSTTEDGMSYTEKETRYAHENGIPILPFIISDKADWPGKKYEESPEKKERLESFKAWLRDGRMVGFWKNQGELGQKVSVALSSAVIDNPRPGYTRGNINQNPQVSSIQPPAEREPVFHVEFSGNEEIKINLNDLVHPHQQEKLEHVKSLLPVVPMELEGMVSQREIDEWNSLVPKMNQEIDEFNKGIDKFNAQFLNVPLPFSFSNIGTTKARELTVSLVFPEWLIVKTAKFNIPLPKKPDIKPNPVTTALNKKKQQNLSTSQDLQRRINRLSHWDKYIVGNKDFDPAGIKVDIIDQNHASFKLDQIQHLAKTNCSGLYICPPLYPCEGTLKIRCHCDELPKPQYVEIPINIFKLRQTQI